MVQYVGFAAAVWEFDSVCFVGAVAYVDVVDSFYCVIVAVVGAAYAAGVADSADVESDSCVAYLACVVAFVSVAFVAYVSVAYVLHACAAFAYGDAVA